MAADLDRNCVLCYLPLIQADRAYTRKRVTVDFPLFPSYVFLFADSSDREVALKTNRIAATIEVRDQSRLRSELRQVRTLLEAGEAVSLFPSLTVGAKCRVVSGPLKGICGTVSGKGRRRKLFVSVTTLGQSACLEIDAAWLERIESN